jgi:2-polyprenyl-6-methoxyphenol hydroxylase-like FAD-dependent oxidoreductase
MYDVIIVGARVAGSSLAILLGRQGLRVLLVDRDRFPSGTLSTHLLTPPAVASLDGLGVLDDVESAGPRRLYRLRTAIGDCAIEGPLRAPESYALCARRDRLDSTLIRHAMRYPTVRFRERTRVEGLVWEDGRVAGVYLRGPRGSLGRARARVVVGADGKFSRIAEWVEAPRYHEVPALRPLYYSYYRGVTPQPEPALELFYQPGRIGFVLPMEPGSDCLALEIQPEEFAAFRADPAGRFEAAFRTLPGMAQRLANAVREGPVRGTRGVDNYLRTPAGPGWALTGDAALAKDPSTGTGIEDAFAQSFLLAEVLGASLAGPGWDAGIAEYHRRRDDALLPGYRGTISYTRTGDVPGEEVAWLRALASNAGFVRQLGMGFSAALRAPGVLPSGIVAAIERSAGRFAATVEAAVDGQQAA